MSTVRTGKSDSGVAGGRSAARATLAIIVADRRSMMIRLKTPARK